jgi:metal-sulfur cluster biosynthetic enzyme
MVRAVLNSVIDPCSAAAGAPAGLVEMGLVRGISLSSNPDGHDIDIILCVTEPGCVMGGSLAEEARVRLSALCGVRQVRIELDGTANWTPRDMTHEYRERLAALRSARIARHCANST